MSPSFRRALRLLGVTFYGVWFIVFGVCAVLVAFDWTLGHPAGFGVRAVGLVTLIVIAIKAFWRMIVAMEEG